VRILPTVATMPQVQTTHARTMLCEINYAKYLRGETRSFCINRFIVSPIMHEQTRFSVLQTSVCVVQNCDARKSRCQKLRARAALEGAHEEREFEIFSGDIDFQTFLHRNAETIRKAVADSLQPHEYV